MQMEFADEAGVHAYEAHPYHVDVVVPYFRPGPKKTTESGQVVWYKREGTFIG